MKDDNASSQKEKRGSKQTKSDDDDGAIVRRLIDLLKQNPNDLEITILDPCCYNNDVSLGDYGIIEDTHNDNITSSASSTTLQEKKMAKQNKKKTISSRQNVCTNLQHLLVLQEGHLGIDAIAFPWITRSIRKQYKRHKQRQQQLPAVQDQSQEMNQDFKYWENMYWITSCLLLMNPDHATVWADKRRSLLKLTSNSNSTPSNKNNDAATPASMSPLASASFSSWWEQEYQFVNLLMTQHSKA